MTGFTICNPVWCKYIKLYCYCTTGSLAMSAMLHVYQYNHSNSEVCITIICVNRCSLLPQSLLLHYYYSNNAKWDRQGRNRTWGIRWAEGENIEMLSVLQVACLFVLRMFFYIKGYLSAWVTLDYWDFPSEFKKEKKKISNPKHRKPHTNKTPNKKQQTTTKKKRPQKTPRTFLTCWVQRFQMMGGTVVNEYTSKNSRARLDC